jgi:hypothetical protein
MDPHTGASPYHLSSPATPDLTVGESMPEAPDASDVLDVPEMEIVVPPPLPVPEIDIDALAMSDVGLDMPEVPEIEIAPPPEIPELDHFTESKRRRMRHRPIIRTAPAPPATDEPVLSNVARILIFILGLGLLIPLVAGLVAAVGTASLGPIFCLTGLVGFLALIWLGLLLVRTGRRIAAASGAVYERMQVFGRTLREVAPGVIKELPVNLPSHVDVLDLPVAYSELRYLDSQEAESPTDLAVDLILGSIASLVGRDDVILAHRVYPVEERGMLTRSKSDEVSRPVLTRRRAYVGPGVLEEHIAQNLRTDRAVTVEEFLQGLLEVDVQEGTREGARQVVRIVDQALAEDSDTLDEIPNLDAALDRLESYRQSMQRANPELYKLLEAEIRYNLGGRINRSVARSLLDLAGYSS